MVDKESMMDKWLRPAKDAVSTLKSEDPKGGEDHPEFTGPQNPATGNEDAPGFTGPPEPTVMDHVRDGLNSVGERVQEMGQEFSDGANQAIEHAKEFTNEHPNFWVGAAPMLMGALLGEVGEGARAGSSGLMQRYKDERDADLSFAKARKAASERAPKFKDIHDPVTGKTTSHKWDGQKWTDTGSIVPKDISYQEQKLRGREASQVRLGANLRPMKGPQGQPMIWDRMNNTTREIFPESSTTPDQRKIIDTAKTYVRAKIEPAMESFYKMKESVEGLKQGNTIDMKAALMNMVKEAQGGGKLSDFDVEFMQYAFGNQKYIERAQEWASGKMNPRLAREIQSKLIKAMDRSKKGLIRKYSHAYRMGSHLKGMSPSKMRKWIGAPEGLLNSVRVKSGGKSGVMSYDDYQDLVNQYPDKEMEILGYE